MGDVNFTIEAINKASSVVTDVRMSLVTLNQALQLAQQVYRAVDQAIDATVGEYVKQANAVRTLNQINGESAEANSRLIQTLDDYKLSSEDAITAQRKLATQQETLNIPTLARLSDEYLKLNDGAARQTFLTENFGRASAGWAEVMAQGSKAIRDRAAATEAGLILDQKAIDNARQLELQQDALADSTLALKVAWGEQLTPVLINLEAYVIKAIEGWQKFFGVISYNKSIQDLSIQLAKADGYTWAQIQHVPELKDKYLQLAMAQEAASKGQDAYNSSIDQGAKLEALYKQNLEDAAAALEADKNKGSMESTKNVFDDMMSSFGAGDERVRALGEAFGYLTEQEADNMVRLHNFDVALKAWGDKPITKDIILKIWYEQFAITQEDLDQNPPPSGGGEQPGFAGGGRFKGWAMVGDSPGGGRTPYTEWVYAPKGAVVFNQSQMSGHSAPPMASGGVMPPASDAPLNLSDDSIRRLADSLQMAILRQ